MEITAGNAKGGQGGSVTLTSGVSADRSSGIITVQTSNSGISGVSGDVLVQTGRATAGISGGVSLQTGAATSGTGGSITLKVSYGLWMRR